MKFIIFAIALVVAIAYACEIGELKPYEEDCVKIEVDIVNNTSSDCKKFCECTNNDVWVEFVCANGTLFNPETLECDQEYNVNCVSGTTSTEIPETTTEWTTESTTESTTPSTEPTTPSTTEPTTPSTEPTTPSTTESTAPSTTETTTDFSWTEKPRN